MTEFSPRPDEYGINEVPEKKQEQTSADRSMLQALRSKIAEKAGTLLMLATFSTTIGAETTKGKPDMENPPAPTASSRIDMKSIINDFKDQGSELGMPEVHTTFFKDENGTWKFNPWSLISQFQLEFFRNNKVETTNSFELPYEYARLFDSGKPLRQEDHDKLAELVEQKVNETFADSIYALSMNKDVYRYVHGAPEQHKPRVTGLAITGASSPEASKYGKKSLGIGNIEEENLKLADLRAKAGSTFIKDALAKQGFDVSQLENIDFGAPEEMQFSEAELGELAVLSSGYEGTDDLDKTMNMVIDYNANKITDQDTLQQLDKIVGDKRKIMVTVKLEGEKKDVLIIPVPLLALLLALPLLRRRTREAIARRFGKGEQLPVGKVDKPGGDKRPIKGLLKASSYDIEARRLLMPASWEEMKYRVTDGSENDPQFNRDMKLEKAGLQKKSLEPKGDVLAAQAKEAEVSKNAELYPAVIDVLQRLPKFVREVPLPKEGTPEFEKIKKNTVLFDLYDNFDDPEALKYGIDYRAIAEALAANYDSISEVDFQGFTDAEKRELYTASFILSAWMSGDLMKRKEAGVSNDELFEGLDYYHDPNKIQYAKMHAQGIRDLVEEKLYHNPEADYADLLEEKAKNLALKQARENQ